jgi:hypothetical protein
MAAFFIFFFAAVSALFSAVVAFFNVLVGGSGSGWGV